MDIFEHLVRPCSCYRRCLAIVPKRGVIAFKPIFKVNRPFLDQTIQLFRQAVPQALKIKRCILHAAHAQDHPPERRVSRDLGCAQAQVDKTIRPGILIKEIVAEIESHAVVTVLQIGQKGRFIQSLRAVCFKGNISLIPLPGQELAHGKFGIGIAAHRVAVIGKVPQRFLIFRRFIHQLLKHIAVYRVHHKHQKIFVGRIILQFLVGGKIIAALQRRAAQPQRDHRDGQHQGECAAAKEGCILQPLFPAEKAHKQGRRHTYGRRKRPLGGIGVPVHGRAIHAGQPARKKIAVKIAHQRAPHKAACQ